MSLSQVKLSEQDALNMLQAAHPGPVASTDMAAAYECSREVVRKMMAKLEGKGLIRRHFINDGRLNQCFYYYIDAAERMKHAADAQAQADAIVKPFKTNIWTPPLSGYEASLRAVAARAVAGR